MQWWCSAQGTTWTWQWAAYPGVWLIAALLAFTYYRMTRGGPADRRGGVIAGWIGIVCIWLALDWPLGPLAAGYLASAHALQFLIIAMIAAPLTLLGVRAAGTSRVPTTGIAGGLIKLFTQPIVAAVFFNVVVIASHVSWVVDTFMMSQAGAFAIDMAWLLSAIAFWWPVIVPVPDRPHFSPLLQILYLFLGTLFHTIIAIIMLMVEFPLYRVYELAPPMSGLTALDDLQIAGGVMETIGTGIMLGIITYRFFHWANRQERDDAQSAADGQLPARS